MSGSKKTDLERNEINKNINGQKAEDARCTEMNKICRRAERMAKDRRSYLLSDEEKTFNNLQRVEEEQSRKSTDLEQEQKLAQAMEVLQNQEIIDMKNKRTEKQLQNDLVRNELIFQINQKKARQNEEKTRQFKSDWKMIEADHEEKRKDIDLLSRKKQLKSDYKKAITDQIRDIAEKQKESLALDTKPFQLIGNLSESKEYFKTKVENGNVNLKTKNENERKESDKLNSEIEKYLTFVDKRTKQQEELKNKKKEEKDRVYNYLVENIKNKNKSSASSERVIHSAYQQEKKLNDTRLAMDNKKESKQLQMIELVKQNELQSKVQRDKEKESKEHDFAESKKILQNIQDFNEVDQKRTTERRQKMIEYGNELRVAIDKRADIRNEQKTQLKNDVNAYSTFFSY